MKAEVDNAVDEERVNESYLLHIYRRPKSDTGKLVGTIELIGSEQHQVFKTAEQLLKILKKKFFTNCDFGVNSK